ncbi:IEC3 subunit of the Ino80 complex, chromatin re-modelling-domain-containing protein [Lasiosphaeria hispida]|uniref:IEC3 subunit of the Ino80 complex, chromatin re-modelling-domain-containing protein n=1 Tax=Lasiosphaeria hispida TaxID=260671 RepID=A0AAJ0HEM2_9PEZI|nr:IEC3 subunit of the Ino80 complex, chromatin re-modelling-domain-containing protein [Lasiosphaeria hispida]
MPVEMMDIDARGRSSLEFRAEDDSGDTRMGDDKPTYRSWKKNRLLDLLLDVNNSAQIPPDKRFDLSLDPPSDSEALCLDIDRPSTPPPGAQPAKSYKRLTREVPHPTFAFASKQFKDLLADLEAGRDSPADPLQRQPHPPSFLTADDIDNYIWEIDTRLAANDSHKKGTTTNPLPTLAPLAHANDHPSNGTYGAKDSGLLSNNRDFALRNPTSVYNWLRKHAPRTFLQDGEAHPDKENGDEAHAPSARGHGRGKGERGAGRGTGGPGRGKRASAAHHVRDKATVAVAETTEFDDDAVYETPGAAAGGKGKRKRAHDEDPGYRPKGGASRATKKKRKSEGGLESTPTAPTKRARKSGGADVSRGGDD